MRTVHKFVLTEVSNDVEMPRGARFLHVDNQRESITFWAEVDTRQPSCVRHLYVVGTGDEVPPFAEHIGSCLMAGGTFVFHLYADPERASEWDGTTRSVRAQMGIVAPEDVGVELPGPEET